MIKQSAIIKNVIRLFEFVEHSLDMSKICTVRCCLSCLILSVASLPALAVEKPFLKAVTVEDNFPYNFKKDDRIQGLGFDVVNTLAERAGYSLKVEVLPWTRALLTARNEAAVLIFSIVRIPEREDSYYWIGPIAKSEVWFYKLKNRTDIVVKDISDARRYLVGDTASNATLPLLIRNDIKVDTAPSDLSSCRKFKIGRVDLVPLDPRAIAVFSTACDIPVDQIKKTVLLTQSSDLYIALGKKTDPNLLARLNAEFNLMVKDKTLQKISNQWNVVIPESKKHRVSSNEK
jgi:polar amino acid transport system substrate-binding protein